MRAPSVIGTTRADVGRRRRPREVRHAIADECTRPWRADEGGSMARVPPLPTAASGGVAPVRPEILPRLNSRRIDLDDAPIGIFVELRAIAAHLARRQRVERGAARLALRLTLLAFVVVQ